MRGAWARAVRCSLLVASASGVGFGSEASSDNGTASWTAADVSAAFNALPAPGRTGLLYLNLGPWPVWVGFTLRAAAANRDVNFYFIGHRIDLSGCPNCAWLPLDLHELRRRIRLHLLDVPVRCTPGDMTSGRDEVCRPPSPPASPDRTHSTHPLFLALSAPRRRHVRSPPCSGSREAQADGVAMRGSDREDARADQSDRRATCCVLIEA